MDPNSPAPDMASLSREELEAIAAQDQQQAPPIAQAPPMGAPAPSAFENFANAAGSMATTASQGLLQGTRNFQTGGGLLFRDVAEALGIIGPEGSKDIRENLANDQVVTKAAAIQAGNEGIGNAATIAGEFLPNMALGGGAQSIMGSLGVGAVKSAAAAGAVSGLLPDTGGDLLGRAENAAVGAGIGAGLAKVGGLLSSRLKVEIDPTKAEKFRTLNMQPRVSQIVVDPKVASSYNTIEMKLASLPGGNLGKVGTQGKQLNAFAENVPKIINELDKGDDFVKSAPLYKQAFEAPKVALTTVQPTAAQNAAKEAFTKLKTVGAEISPLTQQTLQDLAEGAPKTLKQLQEIKFSINDQIAGLPKKESAKLIRTQLFKLHRAVADQMDYSAGKLGVQGALRKANEAFAQETYIKGLQNAVAKSYANGGDVGKGFALNVNQMLTNINKTVSSLEKKHFVMSPELKKVVDAVQTIGSNLTQKVTPPSSGFASEVARQTTWEAAKGAAAAGAVYTNPVTAAAAMTTAKGLQLMMATQTGIKLLAKMGKGSIATPAARLALTTAYALGSADQMKHPEMKGELQSGHLPVDMENLTPEQLQAIADQEVPQAPDAPMQGEMPVEAPPQGPATTNQPQVQYY